MDRLSTLDAEFLHLEDPVSHMHIAGICTFADPPPDFDDFTAMIGARLGRVPRYRQRVRDVPLGLGRPIWVDDPHFNLAFHLRHTALPAPGTDADLCRLMGRLMSQPLDRERPLWETWMVEGLAGDRWALIFKVHHCMVDGVAGVGLLEAMLDVEAEPGEEPVDDGDWQPRPEPPAAAKVLDAWVGAIGDTRRTLGSVASGLKDPVGGMRKVGEYGAGLLRFGSRLRSTPESSITGAIGPHRRWAHRSVELEAVKRVGHTLGGTVNDVVLTAITLGYRDLLVDAGEDPSRTVLTSLVPVSVRGSDGDGVLDNRVSALLLDLPVDYEEPLECLGEVRARMADLKASHMAEAGNVVTDLSDLAPPVVVETLSKVGLLAQHRTTQRSVTTVTTNVPGPQFPLYCLGQEMLEYLPFVPISYGLRVGTAILSYNGRVAFGLTADLDVEADIEVLGDGIVAGMDRLLELT